MSKWRGRPEGRTKGKWKQDGRGVWMREGDAEQMEEIEERPEGEKMENKKG